ncbi:hypothetical protein GCM10025857_19630 [Alicyclobacillus contaminans]|nr:hypothetical protein GCM10025857_19630 [Alicyclobacillus contaminans]
MRQSKCVRDVGADQFGARKRREYGGGPAVDGTDIILSRSVQRFATGQVLQSSCPSFLRDKLTIREEK